MLKNKKILIVEDEEPMAQALKEKLEAEGFEIFTLKEGGRVVEFCKKKKIDLVLLDLILPNEDGFKILKKLRRDEILSDIPVIVLSNLTQDSDKEEAMEAGADDYMVKANVMLSDIVRKVKDTLEGIS